MQGPQDPLEQAFVHSRIEQVRVEIMNDQKRLYQLHAYNCQHFAMQMRTGKAVSPDAASVFDSLKAGLNAGVESWRGRDEGAVDAGDWKSSVSGALSMLWDGGMILSLYPSFYFCYIIIVDLSLLFRSPSSCPSLPPLFFPPFLFSSLIDMQ